MIFDCQSVDPLSISDDKIERNEINGESHSDDDDDGGFVADDSDSDQKELVSDQKSRSEEIVVVSILAPPIARKGN